MKNYPKGLFYNNPREQAPDFVKGSIAIKKDDFQNWLTAQEPNEKGYIYISVLNGRENKPYCVLDDYKAKGDKKTNEKEVVDVSDIPF